MSQPLHRLTLILHTCNSDPRVQLLARERAPRCLLLAGTCLEAVSYLLFWLRVWKGVGRVGREPCSACVDPGCPCANLGSQPLEVEASSQGPLPRHKLSPPSPVHSHPCLPCPHALPERYYLQSPYLHSGYNCTLSPCLSSIEGPILLPDSALYQEEGRRSQLPQNHRGHT